MLKSQKKNERKSKRENLLGMSKKNKLKDAFKNKKIKTTIDFDKNECNNIKSIAVKGKTNIDITSTFIRGKMSMFAKVSFKSFVYDLIDVFCFPSEGVRKIYNQYDIIKCHMYLNLTDSKSSS